MTERYLGGGQTPLTRGLLRAVVIRSRFDGYVDFEFNDTDSAGIVPSKSGDVSHIEVVSAVKKHEWLPLSWEFPFYRLPADSTRRLRISHPYPLTIAGVKIGPLVSSQLILTEFEREVEWAEQCFVDGTVSMWIDVQAVQERARILKEKAMETIHASETLGDFWLSLGKSMLGEWLREVDVVSFVHDFWRLTQENAKEERFSLLSAFLREPNRLADLYAQARGVQEYDSLRLPFFLVYEKEGWWIREELRNERDMPKDAETLTDYLCDKKGISSFSVVPKILPLIVQLRSLGTIYLTDPPYLAAAQRFAEALGIAQRQIISIKFDFVDIVEKKIWRALLRDFHKRFSGVAMANAAWCDTYWRYHPTLIFLWVFGGKEMIQKAVETATIRTMK